MFQDNKMRAAHRVLNADGFRAASARGRLHPLDDPPGF